MSPCRSRRHSAWARSTTARGLSASDQLFPGSDCVLPPHAHVSREAIFLHAHARSWLICCLAERGEFGKGLALGAEAVRIAEAGDFPISRCSAYNSLGY